MSKHRAYAFTFNNYPSNVDDLFQSLFDDGKVRYIVYGRETAPTTGTPHLQGHIDFNSQKTITGSQKYLQKHHIKMSLLALTSSKHAANNREYCKKDGDFKEHGDQPEQGKRTDLQLALADIKDNPDKSKVERMEEFSSVYARYPRFVNEYKLLTTELKILSWVEPPNEWIWGPPGSGKSRPFQEMIPPPFSKTMNKWWDGYDGEEVVLLEDIEPFHECLGYHIKKWADRYPFNGEVKGYTIKIRPKRFIITSNFEPKEIFHNAKILWAIERRFKIIKKGSYAVPTSTDPFVQQ